MQKMPTCSQCDKPATAQCESCSLPFCGEECHVKSQCCIGGYVSWPSEIRNTWIEQGILTKEQYERFDWYSVDNDITKALVRLMKTAPDDFYAFKFGSQQNTITVLYAGGGFDRLIVWVNNPDWTGESKLKSMNTKREWRSLDKFIDALEKEGKRFEVCIPRP